MFTLTQFDHIGLRVTDRDAAQAFYAKLGFHTDPQEDSPESRALGLINKSGIRLHLVYNGQKPGSGNNILMDVPVKWPGYTHAAFIVDDFDALLRRLDEEGIPITEGPSVFGHGRRKVCFVRDPDGNVLEFNQIL